MSLVITPNDEGGYTATSKEFPDVMVDAPTYGLAEQLGLDAINQRRHDRLWGEIARTLEEAEDEAVLAKAEAVARKRGRPKKVVEEPAPAPVVEGADVQPETFAMKMIAEAQQASDAEKVNTNE